MPDEPDDLIPGLDPDLARHMAKHAAPAACADAVIRDDQGRILIVDPTYKAGWDLPGGMLEDEEPVHALIREVREELGLTVEVGRLLALDTVPATVFGRTLLAFLYAAHPSSPIKPAALVLEKSEIRAARFAPVDEALALLPAELSRRVAAALAAQDGSRTALLRHGHLIPSAKEMDALPGGAEVARAQMVDRLEKDGTLTDPALQRALLQVRREVLMPRCYLPRPTAPGQPRAWQLLDGEDPRDQQEWLTWIHSGESVMVQHQGEALDVPERSRIIVGGGFTSMSTAVTGTVQVLQELHPRPGERVLEAGTGPGITTATLCELVGPRGQVTTIETDPQLVQTARERLTRLGYRPVVQCGDGMAGVPGAAFDKIVVSFAVRCLPPALLQQLAVGGLLLVPVTTGCAGQAGRALVRRTADGYEGVLQPVPFGHRPARGLDLLLPPPRKPEQPVHARRSTIPLPPTALGGFWVAAGYLLPGLVMDRSGGQLALHTPQDGSTVTVRPDGCGAEVEWSGPRDVWAEVEWLYHQWVGAGSPEQYQIDLSMPGVQRVTGGTGSPLLWRLPQHPLAGGA